MDKEPIRVLHVVIQMNRNGLESRIMDIYRNVDRNKIQFDFLTHRQGVFQFSEEIFDLGGKIYNMPPINPLTFPVYLYKLYKFFREHKEYKIVHSHLNSYSTWVLLMAKLNNVPIRIAHSRNSGVDKNWKVVFKLLSKLFINIPCTHRFACSKQAGTWLFGKNRTNSINNFRVIPNGFDIEKFAFSISKRNLMRSKLNLTNELAFVHIGRLTFQKNHDFLIDVFQYIHNSNPKSKLFLIGVGELEDNIRNKIKECNLSDSVAFLGSVNNVGDYLQAMDAMIFPSVYEGFGTVVIESQCAGLPTLASDVLPAETKVTECLQFLSIKTDSVEKWANKILQMIENVNRIDRSDEIKKAGYDIKDSYRILSDFYLSVV